MLILDPCKKCIVRACCQIACDIKMEQVKTISSITYEVERVKNKTLAAIRWVGRDWIEITATLVLSSVVLVEIAYIGYFVIKIIKN